MVSIMERRSQQLQRVFRCIRCSACCRVGGDMFLTRDDVEVIAGYLGVTYPNLERIPVAEVPGSNGLYKLTITRPCFFMDKETGECTIYEARPQACFEYPFNLHAKGDCSIEAVVLCPQARLALHEYLAPVERD